MCTVSWLRQADGYVLLCNRDERHSRKPAMGPKLGETQGIPLIAPIDGDYGGSWIGVNHFGVTLCLLNRYGDRTVERGHNYISRGLLLLDLMHCRERQQFERIFREITLERFRPFTLAMLSAAEPATVIHWTGRERIIHPDAETDLPLVSSSLKDPEVGRLRKEHFHILFGGTVPASVRLLHEYHRSHCPGRGPYSVCMHREDAATVSLSVVTVTRGLIEFSYHGNSPCSATTADSVQLTRATE